MILTGVGTLSPVKGAEINRKKKDSLEIRDIMNERLSHQIATFNSNSRTNQFSGSKHFNSQNAI